MKDIFRNIKDFFKENKGLIFFVFIMVFLMKLIISFSVLYDLDKIEKSVFYNLSLSLMGLVAFTLLIVQYYRKGIKEAKKISQEFIEKNQFYNSRIGDLENQLFAYNETNDDKTQSVAEFEEELALRLSKGLKQGEELTLASFFRRTCLTFEVGVGILYEINDDQVDQVSSFDLPNDSSPSYLLGEGIVGEVAITSKPISLCNLPEQYFESFSGLGKTTPKHLQVFKIAQYVIELALYKPLEDKEMLALERIVKKKFPNK